MSLSISSQAQSLYQQATICDLALGFEPEIEYPGKWAALQRYQKAGISYISLHVATDATSLERTIQYIAYITQKIKENAQHYQLIQTADDISSAKSQNKLGICYVFQGTNPIAKDLNMIDAYYALGVRSMILSYNVRNAIGDGCAEETDGGLSKFGFKVIDRMNEVGMLIDCSHTGYKTSMDAMSRSKKPVIFSHSNVHALTPHPRNLKDDQIKLCAATGGVIGINGIGVLLGDENASPETYVNHIDYIAQLVGVQHVALGTDEIYFPEIMDEFLKNNAVMYPADYSTATKPKTSQWHCIKPHQLIEIVEILLQRGYKEQDIKNILGGNYLRVIKQTWN